MNTFEQFGRLHLIYNSLYNLKSALLAEVIVLYVGSHLFGHSFFLKFHESIQDPQNRLPHPWHSYGFLTIFWQITQSNWSEVRFTKSSLSYPKF